MPISAELAATVSLLNGLIQGLTDASETQDMNVPSKINELVGQMRRLEEAVVQLDTDPHIPLDVIDAIDKSSSSFPLEETLLNDFKEVERVNAEFRDTKTQFKSFSDSLFQ